MRARLGFVVLIVGAVLAATLSSAGGEASRSGGDAGIGLDLHGPDSLVEFDKELGIEVMDGPEDLETRRQFLMHREPSKAEMEDLASIAKQLDISIDEAVRTIGWHDNFMHLVDQIRLDYPDTFAYAEITGDTEATIAFSKQPEATTKAAVAEFEAVFSGLKIDVVETPLLSESEEQKIVEQLHFTALDNELTVTVSSGYERKTNTFEILVVLKDGSPAGTAQAIEQQLQSSDALRQSNVEGLKVTVIEHGPELGGGEQVNHRHFGGEILNPECTSGFGLRRLSPSQGARRGSTAGHCQNALSDDGDVLTFETDYNAHLGDFQAHSGPDPALDKFYRGTPGITEHTRVDVFLVSTPNVNQWLCKNGKTTHRGCEQVHSLNRCVRTNCRQVAMYSLITAPGDSGGPFYTGNTAVGITEGSMSILITVGNIVSVSNFSLALLFDDATGWHVATS